MTAPHWTDALVTLHACHKAIAWARGYESLEAAWLACERGDWMLWLAGRLSGDRDSAARKLLVLCACACARRALPYVRYGETRPLRAIETAERWARGEATRDDMWKADAAYAAYAYAYADAAAAAATDAAYAAAYAAYAAYAADAGDAAAYAAKSLTPKACAEIVRVHYPVAPTLTVEVTR